MLQLNPRIGYVKSNIERANAILKEHGFLGERAGHSKLIDILVLPELAFTGYGFGSVSEVTPYLEEQGKGVSFQWAQQTSSKLGCYTVVGYPEVCASASANKPTIYNSAVMTSPDGAQAAHYRKSFLYEVDEKWGCSEGAQGFAALGPIKGLGGSKFQMGICMDLNPYKFKAPFEAYEFATAAKNNDVSLIICPMAWLHSESPSLQGTQEKITDKKSEIDQTMDESQPDLATVNYWLLRMNPMFAAGIPSKRVAFLCCNRSGWEDNVLYAGSSSIFTFDPSAGPDKNYIRYYGSLGQNEEGLIFATLDVD